MSNKEKKRKKLAHFIQWYSFNNKTIMAVRNINKGLRKELIKFLYWGKEGIVGHEEVIENGKTYVTKIWCKLCAKYKRQIQQDPSLKGAAISSSKAFTEGTNVVTKHHQVFQICCLKLSFFFTFRCSVV